MRLLFVTEEPIDFSGTMIRGGQIHVRNVVQGLRDRGHDVHLVDWNSDSTEPFQHSVSPRTRFVDGPLRTLRKVLSVGHEIDPDVIISKTRKVYIPGLLAARRLGVPHVVHVGSSLDPTGDGIVERLDAASKAARLRAPHDAYFVVCRALQTELVRRGVPSGSIYDVRNAVDATRFRPDPDVELTSDQQEMIQNADGPLLGFVGSISRSKGVFDLAEAVSRSEVDPTILVAGAGPARDEFSAELGDRGRFLGSVPYDNMPAVYTAMDALVLPSYSEGLPRVVLEAGATATPVIATRVGGIPEVVEDGRTGLLYDPGNTIALAESIDRLFQDSDPEKQGRAGREIILNEFSWSAQYDRYETFLESASQ